MNRANSTKRTPRAARWRPGWVVQTAAALGVAAGSLYGVTAAGETVADREPAVVRFSAIDCQVPAGTDREYFMLSVQYLGAFPDRLDVAAVGMIDRLADAFRAHPEVTDVPSVTVGAGPHVHVSLTFESL